MQANLAGAPAGVEQIIVLPAHGKGSNWKNAGAEPGKKPDSAPVPAEPVLRAVLCING
ncbi:hypothetical protein [Glutamicibacter arilaitensis]|uniref:hypothetical protein n=1 Tax=Glutamicibacter arilaitensis TaxID=256701 RepID=UPI003F93A294